MRLTFFQILAVALILAGCSPFRRLEKAEDWRLKYEAGLNYFKNKDYYHTSILFEQILPIVRGLPEGEKVEFYLAYCQYYQKTYLLASNQFKIFSETYARSPLAEESNYMHAYCMYMASPGEDLDQKSSAHAMETMQNFLNQFPGSQFSEQANTVIETCQRKIEKKDFLSARQYLRLKYYAAAIIAFNNFKKNFPDSGFLEEIAYLKVFAQYKMAIQSIPAKQFERYSSTIELYKELIDGYPKSNYVKEAEKFYTFSLSQINKFKNKNS